MDLESAIISLTKGTIRFVEPYTWPDKFEGRFYNASYVQVEGASGNTPPVLACCLTHAPAKSAKGFALYEGLVNYELDDYNILHLHERYSSVGTEKELFLEFFKDFDLASYLSLLLIKRQAFRHEQELRYFLVPGENEMDLKGDFGAKDLSVCWTDFLEDVKISEDCTDTELVILTNVLRLQNIMIEPKRQYIYAADEDPITIDSNL